MTKTKASLILLLTAAIWGSTFTDTKCTVDVFSPYLIIALRFTIAAAVLSVPVWRRRRTLSVGYWKAGFWMGLTLCLAYLSQTLGLALDTSPGKSAFLTAVYCVLTPFLYWLPAKQRPRWPHMAAALLCLAGIGLISLSGGAGLTAGDAVTLASGVFTALNIVSIAMGSQGRDPLLLTWIQMCVVAVFAWISVWLGGGLPTGFSWPALGGAVYLGLFATALCLYLQTVGLKYAGASVGAVLLSLEAVFAVLFSILFYRETFNLRTGIGFLLVFGAILLAQCDPGRRADSAPVQPQEGSESIPQEEQP